MKKLRKVLLVILIIVAVLLFLNKLMDIIFPCATIVNPLSKDEIANIVEQNTELLNEAINEVNTIANSSFHLKAENEKDYLSITKAQIYNKVSCKLINTDNYKDNIPKIIKNKILYSVFKIKGIYLIERHYSENGRLCILFDIKNSLFYNVGFYYSEDNNPIGWEGKDVNFEQNGNQWVYDDEGEKYVTERIIDNWFYYKVIYL